MDFWQAHFQNVDLQIFIGFKTLSQKNRSKCLPMIYNSIIMKNVVLCLSHYVYIFLKVVTSSGAKRFNNECRNLFIIRSCGHEGHFTAVTDGLRIAKRNPGDVCWRDNDECSVSTVISDGPQKNISKRLRSGERGSRATGSPLPGICSIKVTYSGRWNGL